MGDLSAPLFRPQPGCTARPCRLVPHQRSCGANVPERPHRRGERLYGFARPWSANDYFQYENIETPKIIFEFEPIDKLKIDTSYIWYWVASPTDRWNNAGILNNATTAGNANTDSKLGEEYNIRIRYPFPHLKVNVGYAYFKAGNYVEKFKRPGDSHFAYLEVSASTASH